MRLARLMWKSGFDPSRSLGVFHRCPGVKNASAAPNMWMRMWILCLLSDCRVALWQLISASISHPNLHFNNKGLTTTPGTSCPTLCDKRVGSLTSPANHNIEDAGDGAYGLKSVELNWVKRRTSHKPNWFNWVRFMWSTAFDPGLLHMSRT